VKYLFFIIILIIPSTLFSSFVCGLDVDKLVIQKFWQFEEGKFKEKLLILNEDSVDIKVYFRVLKEIGIEHYEMDTSLGIIGGPWEISKESYIVTDLKDYSFLNQFDNHLKVYKDVENKTIDCGCICIEHPLPNYNSDSNKIILTTRANSIHPLMNNIWWEYNSLLAKAGEEIKIDLNIFNLPDYENDYNANSILVFYWPDSLTKRNLKNIKVNSEIIDTVYELSQEELIKYRFYKTEKVIKYDFNKKGELVNKILKFTLTIKVPNVSKPKFMGASILIGDLKNRFDVYDFPLIIIPNKN